MIHPELRLADQTSMRSKLAKRLLLQPAFNGVLRRLLFAPLRGRGVLPRRVWRRLPVIGRFAVDLEDGGRVRYLSRGEYLGRLLYWGGASAYEPATARVLRELAKTSTTFLDVGAYSGWYGLLTKGTNRALRLIAFEPLPANFAWLRDNLLANFPAADVTLEQAAVAGRTRDAVPLFAPSSDLPPSTASLTAAAMGAPVEVPSWRLDDYLETWPRPIDLVKIDAEGAELEILHGAQSLLTRQRPIVLCEVLDRGPLLEEIMAYLAAFDYRAGRLGLGGVTPSAAPAGGDSERNYLFWLPAQADRVAPLLAATARRTAAATGGADDA